MKECEEMKETKTNIRMITSLLSLVFELDETHKPKILNIMNKSTFN